MVAGYRELLEMKIRLLGEARFELDDLHELNGAPAHAASRSLFNIPIVARRPCSDRWITQESCASSSVAVSLPVSRAYSEDREYMGILESSSK